MEHKQVRIIHTNGQVKFVEPHIAADAKELWSYGYVVQDLPEKEEVKMTASEEIASDEKASDLFEIEEIKEDVKAPKKRVTK